MGRLTLNILLSFAQFERELIGERVRDKVAASKKKGMWMGGTVPLGYDVKDRKLVVNKAGARTVVDIYRRYLRLKSVRALREELDAAGIRSKRRLRPDGTQYGNQRFSQGALYLLLQNRTYRGEATHKGNAYPGEHSAIVDKPLWDAVQAVLAKNRVARATGVNTKEPSLLTGVLFDETGERLTPTWSVKKGTRYRYYVSTSLVTGDSGTRSARRRVPAGNLETIVIDRLRTFFSNRGELLDAIENEGSGKAGPGHLINRGRQIAEELGRTPDKTKAIVMTLVRRVEVRRDHVKIDIYQGRLAGLLAAISTDLPTQPHRRINSSERVTLRATNRTAVRRRRGQTALFHVSHPPMTAGRAVRRMAEWRACGFVPWRRTRSRSRSTGPRRRAESRSRRRRPVRLRRSRGLPHRRARRRAGVDHRSRELRRVVAQQDNYRKCVSDRADVFRRDPRRGARTGVRRDDVRAGLNVRGHGSALNARGRSSIIRATIAKGPSVMRRLMSVMSGLMLAAGLVLVCAPPVSAQTALEGSWNATRAERDGKAADDVVGHRLAFAGKRFEIRSNDGKTLVCGHLQNRPAREAGGHRLREHARRRQGAGVAGHLHARRRHADHLRQCAESAQAPAGSIRGQARLRLRPGHIRARATAVSCRQPPNGPVEILTPCSPPETGRVVLW